MKTNDLAKHGSGRDGHAELPSSGREVGSGKTGGDTGFRERLSALAHEHGSIEALSRACGMRSSTLRKWIAGPSEPNRSRLVAIARGAKVSLWWLATGEGPRDPLRSSGDGEMPGPAEVQKGKATIDNEVDAHVFFSVVSAVQRLDEEIPVDKAVDMAMRMHYALEMLAVHDEAPSRLDDQDLDALARIARKLA